MSFCIAILGYNRPFAMRRLLKSLIESDVESRIPIIISLEYNYDPAHDQILSDFKYSRFENIQIKRSRQRMGLKSHVLITGALAGEYGGVVILEDDLFLSGDVYSYLLGLIESGSDVVEQSAAISLYNPSYDEYSKTVFQPVQNNNDIYRMLVPASSGYYWSKQNWNDFRTWLDENEHNLDDFERCVPQVLFNWPDSSWKKLFGIFQAVTGRYTIYPYRSRITNFSDRGGTHIPYGTDLHQSFISIGVNSMSYKLRHDADPIVSYDQFWEIELNIKDKRSHRVCLKGSGLLRIKNVSEQDIYVIERMRRGSKSIPVVLRPIEANFYREFDEEETSYFYINLVSFNHRLVRRSLGYYSFLSVAPLGYWNGVTSPRFLRLLGTHFLRHICKKLTGFR